MRLRVLSFQLLLLTAVAAGAQNSLPSISNISTSEEDGWLTLRYDLSDPEEDSLEVIFSASFDEGSHFLVDTRTAEGDIGWPVLTGPGKEIRWYFGDVWDRIEGKTLRLAADDGYEIPIEELVAEVDSSRLRTLLEFIASPRSFDVDEEHLYAVRDSISGMLENYDYKVRPLTFTHRGRTATNVVGRKSGIKYEAETIIMDAHYDAKIDAPGADDNGSGVVGFMEAARVLAPYHFERSLEFIGFDQEEEGLLGSINYAFFGGIEPWKRIQGVLNFEMIGYYSELPGSQRVPAGFELLFPGQYADLETDEFRGNFIFLTGNDASIALVTAFESAAENYVEGLKVVSGIVPLNGLVAPDLLRSDHAPFWFKGLPAIMITDAAEFRNANYHEVTDVIDTLDFDFMMKVTQASVATMAEMAGIRHAAVEVFQAGGLVTGIEEGIGNPCRVSIYPNPVSERLHLSVGRCFAEHRALEGTVTDLSGRLIRSFRLFDETHTLDVSDLPCGTYLLRISNPFDSSATRFVVH